VHKGIRQSAIHVSKSLTDFIKGSAGGLLKIKGAGDDLAFLLGRMVQYRNALLGFVDLRDPIGSQSDMLGNGVLVYEDETGKGFSCHVTAAKPIRDMVKDRTGISIREADLSDPEHFHGLIDRLYRGREGIVERRNVLSVVAPSGSGLDAKAILNKAASLYRKSCRQD